METWDMRSGNQPVQFVTMGHLAVHHTHGLDCRLQHGLQVGQAVEVLHKYVLDALLAQSELRHEAVGTAQGGLRWW